jgi:hypothetical protein
LKKNREKSEEKDREISEKLQGVQEENELENSDSPFQGCEIQ